MLWKGPPQQTLFFSSVHDGIYRLGKGHICMLSSASLPSGVKVHCTTVSAGVSPCTDGPFGHLEESPMQQIECADWSLSSDRCSGMNKGQTREGVTIPHTLYTPIPIPTPHHTTHTHTYTHIRTHTHAHAHISKHARTHTHIHTQRYARTHAHPHSYTHARARASRQAGRPAHHSAFLTHGIQ